jgi:hypothetical protein
LPPQKKTSPIKKESELVTGLFLSILAHFRIGKTITQASYKTLKTE